MSSRLPPVKAEELAEGSEQKTFYNDLLDRIAKHFGGQFQIMSPTKDSFIGPFDVFLHTPSLGRPFQETTLNITKIPMGSLTKKGREIAILVVAVHFQAAYELYAHTNVAAGTGLTQEEIEVIKQGLKPKTLDSVDSVVFETAELLVARPGPLPAAAWQSTVDSLGQDGALALVQLVGFYCWVSVVLNGLDVQVPR